MSATLRGRRQFDQAILQSRSGTMALLGQTAGLDGLRVLILGTAAADALCALLHTECRHAEARLPDAHVEARSADLVLAPHVSLVTASRVIAQAGRSLCPGGRIVVAVPPHERDFASLTIWALLRAGFEAPRLETHGGQTRILARRGEDAPRS